MTQAPQRGFVQGGREVEADRSHSWPPERLFRTPRSVRGATKQAFFSTKSSGRRRSQEFGSYQ